MLESHQTTDYALGSFSYWNERLIYMDFVDKKYDLEEKVVQPIDAYRYQGNLFGLFKIMNIPSKLHFYTMYMNGYTNPMSYEGKKISFKVPSMPPIPEE